MDTTRALALLRADGLTAVSAQVERIGGIVCLRLIDAAEDFALIVELPAGLLLLDLGSSNLEQFGRGSAAIVRLRALRALLSDPRLDHLLDAVKDAEAEAEAA